MTIVVDDFERASVGGNYDNGPGLYGICEIVNSSDLRAEGGSAARHIRRNAETFDDDQFAEGTISVFNDVNNVYAQLHVRGDTGATSECYVASAWARGDGTIDIFLEHNDGAGTFTQIGPTVEWSDPGAAGDVFRLETRGTNLRVLYNGTLIIHEFDTTLTGGEPGIGAFIGSGGAAITDLEWESFICGDLGIQVNPPRGPY